MSSQRAQSHRYLIKMSVQKRANKYAQHLLRPWPGSAAVAVSRARLWSSAEAGDAAQPR